MDDPSIILIGAGFAGLSTGIYAQMNGYQTQIFEMHNKPGGLCTAWTRKGYTIDGCIHWLVGSSPQQSIHRYWQEVGIVQDHDFIDLDEYGRYEGADGRTVIFYTDVDRLEKHLREFSPQDTEAIGDFIDGIRMCIGFDTPVETDPWLKRVRSGLKFALNGRKIQRWLNLTASDYVTRFKDPVLREALLEMWFSEFSMFFMLFTFAYLHKKAAGYPIGGSMPMSETLAQRYTDLGGAIHYKKRVAKILVENDRAVGVRLVDGSEHRADRVISAADGHATIFEMLDGKYADAQTREPYESWPTFPSLLYVGLGASRTFEDEPKTVSGISFPLQEPMEIGASVRDRLEVRIFNHDPTLAPEGKTAMVVMLEDEYAYWKALAEDRPVYNERKDQVAGAVIQALDQRYPGLADQIEMVDVATPVTFERYTGNWKGSFEGWLLTPQNASTMMRPMSQTLPGLDNFYMCGQWVEPGGGLPTGVMSGRRLVKALCKEDGREFGTTIAT
jgi:phytoene dehydrogenase-like protein